MEIRGYKNVALSPTVDFLTLCQWYNQHIVAGVKEVYLKTPAGIKGGKGSTFSLELFIHEDRVSVSTLAGFQTAWLWFHWYSERTGENDVDDSDDGIEIVSSVSTSKNKKRKGKQHQNNTQVKRMKGVSESKSYLRFYNIP